MPPYGDKEYPTGIWRELGLYNDAGSSRDGTTSLSAMNDSDFLLARNSRKGGEKPFQLL